MRKTLLAILIVVFCSGCYTMKVVAPAADSVATLSEYQPAVFKKKVKVWYALWGLVSITDNTSARIIAENNLKEVRVTTKTEFVDSLIGIFTGIATIFPRTMIIEGNR